MTSPDARAERLLTQVGLPLIHDIREDLEAAHRAVRNLNRADLEALACILAACVPDTVSVASLAWWRFSYAARPKDPPCGTQPAYRRHQYRSEEPCGPCREAHRVYTAGRRQAKREAAA